MRFDLLTLARGSLLACALGCEPTATNVVSSDPRPPSTKMSSKVETTDGEPGATEGSPAGENEKVDPPTNISGAYFRCADEKIPNTTDTEARIVCGVFDDVSKQKADLTNFVEKPVFSLEVPAPALAQQRLLSDDPEWHLVFIIKASDAVKVNKARSDGVIRLKGVHPTTGENIELAAKISSVMRLSPIGIDLASGRYTPAQSEAVAGPELEAAVPQLACAGLSVSDSGVHLGRYLPQTKRCSFSYGVTVEDSANFMFIASSIGGVWLNGANASIPATAIPLGRDANGKVQHLCRATVPNQGVVLGKIATGYDGCNMAAPNGYIQVTSYQVLSQ